MTTEQTLEPTSAPQSWTKIGDALTEIAQLAHADTPREAFFARLLALIVEAQAAAGGAVWLVVEDRRRLELLAADTLPADFPHDAPSQQRHAQLVNGVLVAGKSAVVGPATADDSGNPTPYILLLAPLRTGQRLYGVIELFQKPGDSQHVHQSCFRFLEAMAELAAEYLRTQQDKRLQQRDNLWGHLDRFTRSIHHGIDLAQTAYTVANEARGLIECDRVTVVICHRGRPRVEAISGQVVAEKRANVVRLLLGLTRRVIKSGQPLWHTDSQQELPPQLEEPLNAFVDESHTQALAILPLVRPQPPAKESTAQLPEPEIIGALVVERIKEAGFSEPARLRIEEVSVRSAAALANALDHDRVFLMPLWRALGKTRWFVEARRLPKTLLAAATIVALGVGACILPADFRIAAQGTLQPAERRDVFVQEAGVVSEVRADHGDRVKAGTELVRLRSRELEVQIAEVSGRQNSTLELLRAVRWSEGNGRLSQDERIKLSGQYSQLQKTYDSLTAQLKLLKAKEALLRVRSPIDGRVATWDVKERLQDRPVEKGQVLVSVANPSTWELELLVPENHAGYIATAWEAAQANHRNLRVSYILATDPAQRHTGLVTEIQQSAEIHGEEGNTVLVRVKIDPADLQSIHLRSGAAVNAQIDCGRRSLAYVWGYDVLAFVRSKILFRL